MIRQSGVLLFLVILFPFLSCQRPHSDQVLIGKWSVENDPGNYYELWFTDSLAMTIKPATRQVETFSYQVRNDHLILQSLQPARLVVDLRIDKVTDSIMTLSSTDSQTTCRRLSSLPPDISSDAESNLLSIRSRLDLDHHKRENIINRIGFSCGDTTGLTYPVRKMMDRIEKHDYDGIRKELYSSDSTDQFLSYIVTSRLEDMGKITLTNPELNRMKSIRTSGELVPVCFRVSRRQAVSLKDLLSGHVVGIEAERWFGSVLEMSF